MDSDSLFSRTTGSTVLPVLLVSACPSHSASSIESTLLSNSCFQHFESFCTIFPQLNMECDADTKASNFLACKNKEQDNTHLYLRGHYSVSTHATALHQTGNDLADFMLSMPGGRNLLLAVVVLSCTESGNYLITPCNVQASFSIHASSPAMTT